MTSLLCFRLLENLESQDLGYILFNEIEAEYNIYCETCKVLPATKDTLNNYLVLLFPNVKKHYKEHHLIAYEQLAWRDKKGLHNHFPIPEYVTEFDSIGETVYAKFPLQHVVNGKFLKAEILISNRKLTAKIEKTTLNLEKKGISSNMEAKDLGLAIVTISRMPVCLGKVWQSDFSSTSTITEIWSVPGDENSETKRIRSTKCERITCLTSKTYTCRKCIYNLSRYKKINFEKNEKSQESQAKKIKPSSCYDSQMNDCQSTEEHMLNTPEFASKAEMGQSQSQSSVSDSSTVHDHSGTQIKGAKLPTGKNTKFTKNVKLEKFFLEKT